MALGYLGLGLLTGMLLAAALVVAGAGAAPTFAAFTMGGVVATLWAMAIGTLFGPEPGHLRA